MGSETVAPPALLAASHERSRQLGREWLEGPARQAIAAHFAAAGDDGAALSDAAVALFADDRWVAELIAPLIANLAADPWNEPPLRASRDRLRSGVILFEDDRVSLAASVLGVDALAALPAPVRVVVPGRRTVTRYVRSGRARLRRWRAEPAGPDFAFADARPCRTLPPETLRDGAVLAIDGRVEAHLIEAAQSDVVTLTATIRADAAPFAREYDIASGALLRVATNDDRASRSQILLTLLRLSGRGGAAPQFEAATRDPAFFLRWSAMREWLALDARAALPRLAEMAADDPNAELRATAAQTLAMVEAKLADALCPA